MKKPSFKTGWLLYFWSMNSGPIGVFDSGYGGLTVLKAITDRLPAYDYIYLGDNARAPYGPRSFETVYQYTWQCVQWFFTRGCPLVILACNTASAKALRTIQQRNLPRSYPGKRVLGVIRPTSEVIGNYTRSNQVGILGTTGTVTSLSYPIEIEKFFPAVRVVQQACPMWVPLIENNEFQSPGAAYFIEKNVYELMAQAPGIDTILLACTHYPLLMEQLKKYVSNSTTIVPQGEIVANSLEDYLHRHPEITSACSKAGQLDFYTTDAVADFERNAALFFGKSLRAQHLEL